MCPELVEGHTASTSSARRPQRFLPRKASQVSIRTAELAPRPTASLRRSRKSAEQSERIRRRRGLTLLAMTLVLPGSAQLVAGNRRLGRLALRIWISLCLLALLGALLALILPEAAVAVVTFGPTLVAIQIVIITLGLGWVALIVDAGRLAHPPGARAPEPGSVSQRSAWP